ncbi:hypothetical protein [Xanthomonas phage BUDD]|nr:hypothetical protein [Xanthomonas phage BUDD]
MTSDLDNEKLSDIYLKVEAIKTVYSALHIPFPEEQNTHLYSVLDALWETARVSVDIDAVRQESWQEGYDDAREDHSWDSSSC